MRQVVDWTRGTQPRAGQYAQRFAENRIDLFVPPDLTYQDLKRPGV